MAMKQAANSPAPRFHTSFVSRYVAMAVKPLQMQAHKKSEKADINHSSCLLLNKNRPLHKTAQDPSLVWIKHKLDGGMQYF